MRVGRQEVLLPTTMVGNYPEPRWYAATGGRYPDSGSSEAEREGFEDAIHAIVRDQEAAGLDIIADGRVYGADASASRILTHYLERTDGLSVWGPRVPFSSGHLTAPTCTGPLAVRDSFHLETLRALRRATDRPVKVSYTGLQALTLFVRDEHYRDARKLSLAFAELLNHDFHLLAQEGVDVIQIDEFAWSHGMGDWEVEALNRAVEGVDATFWVHVCWGRTTRPRPLLRGAGDGFKRFVVEPDPTAAAQGRIDRTAALWPRVHDAQVQALTCEIDQDAGDLDAVLRGGWDRDLVAGIIDVRSVEVETAHEVASYVRRLLEQVPAERLGLSTDCGMSQLPRLVCAAKLRALADGVAIVRAELLAEREVDRRVPTAV